MRICHITTVHTPFDGRIFHKECKSLAAAGYDVSLVAPHHEDTKVDGIDLIGIPRYKNPYRRILIAPFKAFRKALKTKASVYHLHDPELLLPGFFVSLLGKKVVFDSHEYVGEQIQSKPWIKPKSLRYLISYIYDFLENILSLFFSGIIVAEEDTVKNFPMKRKVRIVRNYPILKDINSNNYANIPRNEGKVIVYVGGLTRIRGIKEIVAAMDRVDATLWLLGPWESEAFKKECKSLPSWSKCEYKGIVPFGKQYDYLRAADIGLATLYPEKNYLRSLPVKAFEYMACKLPIIMSNFPYWEEFFEGNSLFVNPKDPADISDKINKLLTDSDLYNKLCQEGYEKVNKEYSWEEESKKLVSFYNEIAPEQKQQ